MLYEFYFSEKSRETLPHFLPDDEGGGGAQSLGVGAELAWAQGPPAGGGCSGEAPALLWGWGGTAPPSCGAWGAQPSHATLPKPAGPLCGLP